MLREPFRERVLVANATRTRFKRVLVTIIRGLVGKTHADNARVLGFLLYLTKKKIFIVF